MYELLKDDILKESPSSFLEWRYENFRFWFDQIEGFVYRVFDRYGYGDKVELSWEETNRVQYGFNPLNVKVLRIKSWIKDESDVKLCIPVPNDFDVFDVNSSLYILKAELADKPVVAYDGEIRIRFFKIGPDGLFTFLSNKARIKVPLATVLIELGLLKKDDFEIVESCSGQDCIETKEGFLIRFKKYKGTPFDKLILKSLANIRSLDDLQNRSFFTFMNRFVFDTFMLYQFEKHYGLKDLDKKTTPYLLRELFDKVIPDLYNESIENRYTFIHTSQKYIIYYDAIVEFMIRECFDKVLQRQQIYKYRVDTHAILKWLVSSNPRFELVTSEETPFREINLKETVITSLKDPTPAQRTCDLSYKYNIDPINTPDNEKLGLVQRVARNVKLDKIGRFIQGGNSE